MSQNLDRRQLLAGFLSAATLPAVSGSLELLGVQSASASSRLRTISELPASMRGKIAWTVDDGVSNTALSNYLKVAINYDLRFTFFVTSVYQSWFRHRPTIKELLSTGQIQLGNHTHTHRDLTSLSEKKVRQEFLSCHNRMLDNFDYDARPYWRPPYGFSNEKVRDIAAELGYTTEVMWFGSLADATHTNPNAVARNAAKWFRSGRIVIAHANTPVAIEHFDEINAVLQARHLETVTIKDAFG